MKSFSRPEHMVKVLTYPIDNLITTETQSQNKRLDLCEKLIAYKGIAVAKL